MSTSTSKPFGGGRTGDRVSPPGKGKEKVPLSTHLLAGGVAGLAEALAWYVTCARCILPATRYDGSARSLIPDDSILTSSHPLDTIKVRMQLSKSRKLKGVRPGPTYRSPNKH